MLSMPQAYLTLNKLAFAVLHVNRAKEPDWRSSTLKFYKAPRR
jgi:hypothetical protein